MKKRTLSGLLAVCLTLSLTACGGGGGASGGGSSAPSDSESRSEPQSTPEEPPEESSQPEEPDSPFIEVALGETITVAGVDFTFETQDTAKELLPTVQGSLYRALRAKEEWETLFYVKGTVTNNSDTDYNISWIECKCVKNGGNPWISPYFYVDGKSGHGFDDAAIITPGETYTCYLVDRLSIDWLENEYESYQFLFSLPESYEAKPEKLDSGYAITFYK